MIPNPRTNGIPRPSPKPSPRRSPEFVLESDPESLGRDEGEEVGTDDEDEEEVKTGDEDEEEVLTDDVEEIVGVTEATDARRILKRPLVNLGLVSPGLNIAMKKVEASVIFCFSVETFQGQELVFALFEALSRFVLV